MRRLILLFLLVAANAFSQNSVSIYGFIQDASTGETLIGANIYDVHSRMATSTNVQGYYSFLCNRGDSLQLMVSFVGYQSKLVSLLVSQPQELSLKLLPTLLLDEVVISGTSYSANANEMSLHKMSMKQIARLPALGGEVDVLKALQLMPGIQPGNEGGSGYMVRGGSSDQNLVLYDGVPLYYVNHLGGFVSIFNSDAINSLTTINGGFPARYGNRLSSVLDVRMKEGNYKKHEVNGTIGMITSKLCLNGPIKRDTSSYLISIRRFMYDLITRPVTKIAFEGISTGYTFYDINAKANYLFSPANKLYLSFYMGDDVSTIKMNKPELEISKSLNKNRWGNILSSLRWNHVWSPRLFENTTLYYTRYRYQLENSYSGSIDSGRALFNSSIEDVGATTELDYSAASFYKIKFGIGAVNHKFKPTSISISQRNNNENISSNTVGYSPQSIEFNGFVENHISIGSLLNLNLGLRAMRWSMSDTSFHFLEPRMVIGVKTTNRSIAKISYSEMSQSVHLLVNEGVGVPVDYWVPATSKLAPEQSRQAALGFEIKSPKERFKFNIETYYKTMQNLVAFSEGITFLGANDDWETNVETRGKGESYGVELLIEKQLGKTTGWIGYTWSKTNRQFENINGGNPYPFKYDRRHNISIVLMHRFSDRIDFSCTWVYYTGQAVTLATGRYKVIDDSDGLSETDATEMTLYDAQYYGEKNSFRMRDHHRLDIGVNFSKKIKWGERVWNISIYNVYSRMNAYFLYWDMSKEYDRGNDVMVEKQPILKQFTMFPFMPSISYSFKF